MLLGIGVIINFFDRVNLSVAITPLKSEFGLSTVAIGYLLSTYSWTYVLLQLPSGPVLDRYGVKPVIRISAFLWSVASFATGLARGFAGIIAARLLLGIAEAPTFPGNAKAIGEWFPRSERGLATAIFDACRQVRFSDRHSHGRRRGALLGMAHELRLHRSAEPGLLCAVLVRLSRSDRRPAAVAG